MLPASIPAAGKSAPPSLLRGADGQSLIEIALMMPLLVLLMAYAIDFGYFFIVAANLTSAARVAAQYSVLGFSSTAQATLPVAGDLSNSASVAALAMGDMNSLFNSSVTATVQVCAKSLGTTAANLPLCASYGPVAATYVPAVDPESPIFIMQRVDVTYTVIPPVPMSFFKVSLLPSLTFHRQVSMRCMD